MKIDYQENINEFGENVVRIYDFNKEEAGYFRDLIREIIVNRNLKLDLSQADFINTEKINIILGIYKEDEGILTEDNQTFFCLLTKVQYEKMLNLIEPFCHKESKGFQYLYEVDNPTDLLFVPAAKDID